MAPTLHGARASGDVDHDVLSYGSDGAGGVHLCLGDGRIHLSVDAVQALAAGLLAEAARPASPPATEPGQ